MTLNLASIRISQPLLAEWSVDRTFIMDSLSDAIEYLGKTATTDKTDAAVSKVKNIVVDYLQIKKNIIGEREWLKSGYRIPPAPPLHRNIEYVLQQPCPIHSNSLYNKIRDTHTLILMPATINDKENDLILLSKIFFKKQDLNKDPYGYKIPVEPIGKSYWCLVLNDTLTSYDDLGNYYLQCGRELTLPYRWPNACEVLTAFSSMPMHEWVRSRFTYKKNADPDDPSYWESLNKYNINSRKVTLCTAGNEKYKNQVIEISCIAPGCLSFSFVLMEPEHKFPLLPVVHLT